MSIAAGAYASGPTVGSISLYSQIGVGIGAIFVTGLLAYLLAYLQVIKASERRYRRLRILLIATSVPMQFVFAGLVIFESLSILGLL